MLPGDEFDKREEGTLTDKTTKRRDKGVEDAQQTLAYVSIDM